MVGRAGDLGVLLRFVWCGNRSLCFSRVRLRFRVEKSMAGAFGGRDGVRLFYVKGWRRTRI
jgi:hypothetical protein